jgi:hypothetical protein
LLQRPCPVLPFNFSPLISGKNMNREVLGVARTKSGDCNSSATLSSFYLILPGQLFRDTTVFETLLLISKKELLLHDE